MKNLASSEATILPLLPTLPLLPNPLPLRRPSSSPPEATRSLLQRSYTTAQSILKHFDTTDDENHSEQKPVSDSILHCFRGEAPLWASEPWGEVTPTHVTRVVGRANPALGVDRY